MDSSLSLNQARGLALSSFVVNFGTQIFGMVSTPNMKQVADANHYAFSPNPWFIAGFFSLQTIMQLLWIRELFAMRDFRDVDAVAPDDLALRKATLAYVPVFALGGLCIAAWLVFWNRSMFGASQVFVTINTVAQLVALFTIPGLRGLPRSLARPELLLHLVAKTFAGVGVLDLLDNGAVFLKYAAPGTVMRAGTVVLFVVLALATDPIFGVCLVYDLTAMAAGQSGMWGRDLYWMVCGLGAVVVLKALSHFNMSTGTIGLD